MEKELTFKEIFNHINSGYDNQKANCTVGWYISDCYKETTKDKETTKEVENLIVKKPTVLISSFVEDNELFYEVKFRFKSFNDADYKQIWKFICRFTDKAKAEGARLEAGETLEKFSTLAISIVPEAYKGKYFAYVSMPFTEMISATENAFEGSAEISVICEEADFGILLSDDDVIDPRSIEQEAEREIEAEFGV